MNTEIETISLTGAEIYGAIHRVYAKVGYVLKSGKVDSPAAKYKYAGEADFIEALRPAMIEEGLITLPVKILGECRNIMSGDKPKNHACYIYTFRVIHCPTGQHIDIEAAGEGIGNDDKSSYKAATGAQKYALRQLFLIETGDDPDKDPVTAREEEEKRKQAAAEQAAIEKSKAELERKMTASTIPIPPPDDDLGLRDWPDYTLKIIGLIKATKSFAEFNIVRNANKEGLEFLALQDEKLRGQITEVSKQKAASFKAPPSPPIE